MIRLKLEVTDNPIWSGSDDVADPDNDTFDVKLSVFVDGIKAGEVWHPDILLRYKDEILDT